MKTTFLIYLAALIATLPIVTATAAAENILSNGNFDLPDPANPQKPAAWDAMDGTGVQWTDAPNVAGENRGKAIRMDTSLSETAYVDSCTRAGVMQWVFPHPKSNAIAETYGLSLYSAPGPVEPGKSYRISFDFMSEKGTAGKVWFRGYSENGEKLKRVYEGVLDCNSKGAWKHFTGIFNPTKNRPVTKFRVMLFTYYPAGVSWFDNVTVEPLDEVPPTDTTSTPTMSTPSAVPNNQTIKSNPPN
jgi:hypothetical protein